MATRTSWSSYIKVEQALCKGCTNQPIVWCEVCIHAFTSILNHIFVLVHCWLTVLFWSPQTQQQLPWKNTAVQVTPCIARPSTKCFSRAVQVGNNTPLTTRVHATIAPAQNPAFVILSPRLLFMVQCDGIPCMATVKDSRGKFFSPNCEGKMHKCSWRQCSRWLEHSFFRSQCPYKLNKLADTTLVFCLIGHSFKRKRLLQNLVMGTEKRIRIIACKHKTAYVGRKILGSRFLSSWWNAMQ